MLERIPFNKPIYIEKSLDYIKDASKDRLKISGDGFYTKKVSEWFTDNCNIKNLLLTTSCTHALEMTSLLSNIQEGDEIIMPSYTFVSTAIPFALRGAKIIFVDIRPDTLNIDENLIENAITQKTKAIVPVHYAGVSCEMDSIIKIAKEKKILVIEDAAQGVMSKYKEKYLGTIGDFGCYSFHETKNFTMGEGGAILINNNTYSARAEIIREKGTNRSKFFRGMIDKYTWIDIGSSYLPSELNVAYLYAQLKKGKDIIDDRMNTWNIYNEELSELKNKGLIELPVVPKECTHNAHMFYIKVEDLNERTKLIDYLKNRYISSVFHYIPLHNSIAGQKFGEFRGNDVYTTKESERLLRLPLYYGMKSDEVFYVIKCIKNFYKS